MKKFVSIVIVLTLVLGLIPTTTFAYHEHYFEEIVTQRNSHPHKAVIECECGEAINLPTSYLYGCAECKDIFCDFPIYLHDYSIVTKTNTGITAECDCKPNTFYTFDNEEEWERFYREDIKELRNAYEELTIELANESYVDSKDNDIYVDIDSIFSRNAERNHPHAGVYKNHNGVDVYLSQALNSKCRYCINEELCSNYDTHSCLYDYEEYDDYFEFICFCGKTTKVHRKRLNDFFEDRERDNKATVEELNEMLASQEYHNSYVANQPPKSEAVYTKKQEESTLTGTFYTPQTLSQGLTYEIRGNFSSNYEITSLNIHVNNSNGATVLNSQLIPYSYDVVIDSSSKINHDIRFEQLSPGIYTLYSEVTDASGATGTSTSQFEILSNSCCIEEETTITFNFTSLPETIRSTGGFNLTGTISSNNANITEIYGYIKDTNENTYDSSYDMVMSNAINIQPARLNQELSFGSLQNGQYKLVVVAKTSNGEAVFEHYFTVERGSSASPSYTSDSRSIVYYRNFTPTFFEVVNEAALRSIPYKSGTVLAKIKEGTILRLTGKCYNEHSNVWYILEGFDGIEKGFIYSGNLKEHSHKYETLKVNDSVFEICKCGYCTVSANNANKLKQSTNLLLAAIPVITKHAATGIKQVAGKTMVQIPAAAGLAAADTPALPIGDVLGVILLGATIFEATAAVIPTVGELQNILTDALKNPTKETEKGKYRKVMLEPNGLKYIDSEYLNISEAFTYVLSGGHVWCETYDLAKELGKKYPYGCFSEIDGGDDNPKPDYFYHFHFGQKKPRNTVGGHIFYSASPSGKLPH